MIEKWNSDCFCISLDSAGLRAALQAQAAGLAELIETRCPHLFAALVYRGDKLTRRVWDEILNGDYVAQELVAPSERRVAEGAALKVDMRNYVYAGAVQLRRRVRAGADDQRSFARWVCRPRRAIGARSAVGQPFGTSRQARLAASGTPGKKTHSLRMMASSPASELLRHATIWSGRMRTKSAA